MFDQDMVRVLHPPTAVLDPTNPGTFAYTVDGALAYQLLDPAATAMVTVRPYATATYQSASPSAQSIPFSGASPDGVFLSGLAVTLGGSKFTFSAPAGGVQLLQTPATNGLTWTSAGVDPVHQSTVAFSGGINPTGDTRQTGEEVWNVCGELVETWRVDGTLTLTAPGFSLTDLVSFDFATQRGGLLVADRHQITSGRGLDGSTLVALLNEMTPQALPNGNN